MNSFAERYSTTSPISQLRKFQHLADQGEEFSDTAWGSEAGFGSLAKGPPTFTVPDVPDVSSCNLMIPFPELKNLSLQFPAHSFPETTYR